MLSETFSSQEVGEEERLSMENAITIYNESNEEEKGVTESQFSLLMQEIQRIGIDIQYIRSIVQAKPRKVRSKTRKKETRTAFSTKERAGGKK